MTALTPADANDGGGGGACVGAGSVGGKGPKRTRDNDKVSGLSGPLS